MNHQIQDGKPLSMVCARSLSLLHSDHDAPTSLTLLLRGLRISVPFQSLSTNSLFRISSLQMSVWQMFMILQLPAKHNFLQANFYSYLQLSRTPTHNGSHFSQSYFPMSLICHVVFGWYKMRYWIKKASPCLPGKNITVKILITIQGKKGTLFG